MEIVRDSCILNEELGYEQMERLMAKELSQLAELEAQRKVNIGIKICPVCQVEHMNENEVCSLCEPTMNY